MRRTIQNLIFAVCASTGLALPAATIRYAVDGSSGEYCNQGYGITVTVSTPSTGCTIEYGESETGPWRTEPVAYTDVCTQKPVWFRISATGYETVTDKALVTITPKTLTEDCVWVEEPSGGYVYDGTAKEPPARFDDPAALLTENDFTVTYRGNVNAGTAYAVFTGRNNYAGTVEVPFEIAKAENAWTTAPSLADWTYGQTPSEPVSAAKDGTAVVTWSSGAKPTLPGSYTATFTVPESQNYKELTEKVPFTIRAATIRYVADGSSGEYCNQGYGITVSVSTPSTGCTIEYGESESGPWTTEPVAYTDVCMQRPVWFRISATGYETVTDKAFVTITPKTLTEDCVWVEEPAGGYVYDGTAKEPPVRFDDPAALLTENDFTVAYRGNVDAGTAHAVFTGRNNYAGTVEVPFEIRAKSMTDGTDEPGTGSVPEGGLSRYDATFVYDGAGHTIDVEALSAVKIDGLAPTLAYALAEEGPYRANPFVFTNATVTSVWYRLSLPNYADYTHEARLAIRKRALTLTSGDGEWDYDGAPHSNTNVTVSAPGYVPGEGMDYSRFAFITEPGSCRNTFDVRPKPGTLASNYELALEYGTLTVTESRAKIVLDALGGQVDGATLVTQEVHAVYGELPVPVRAGYRFAGWYLGVTSGAPKAVSGGATVASGNHRLFARWTTPAEHLFTYEKIGDQTVRITGLKNPSAPLREAALPDTIDGLFVTEIAAEAFANAQSGTKVAYLPVFCTNLGRRAFGSVKSLEKVVFVSVRRWDVPEDAAEVEIGAYAFSGTALSELELPEEVAFLGDYAFGNCKALAKVTVFGHPKVGKKPFRRAGTSVGGVLVHLDPALAGDADYMNRFKQEIPQVTVRTDAIVRAVRTGGFALHGQRAVLTLSVERAGNWGAIDPSAIKVEYSPSLGEPARMLKPVRVGEQSGGTLQVEVEPPEGSSGFFRVMVEK